MLRKTSLSRRDIPWELGRNALARSGAAGNIDSSPCTEALHPHRDLFLAEGGAILRPMRLKLPPTPQSGIPNVLSRRSALSAASFGMAALATAPARVEAAEWTATEK